MADYYWYNDNSSSNRRKFLGNTPTVTRNLIIINIIFFVATLLNESLMFKWFALYTIGTPEFHSWQIITHMFMHGGFWHILFNMYTLWMFGSVLERMIGEKKYLIFYFVCGLGSVALHAAVEHFLTPGATSVCVGASGAIYGVIIGYAMLFPESKLTLLFPPVTLSAKWMVIIFAGIELFTGLGNLTGSVGLFGGIAHFAHLGGMLFGWLLIRYWRQKGNLFDRN
ncbi:MAG: rhomboid family intramembrane serine protease [Bacteroidia bacterium]|nr:rhomboid family intramembrane serine protease [Bacteroidia bacterium]